MDRVDFPLPDGEHVSRHAARVPDKVEPPRREAMLRVLLVHDQALMRGLVRQLLDRQPHTRVVGEAGGCEEAVTLAAATDPHLILIDHQGILEPDAVDCLAQLLAAAPAAHILLVAGDGDVGAYRRAIHLGARGVVFKTAGPEVLLKAIAKVGAGELWLDRALMLELIELGARPQSPAAPHTPRTRAATLTPREREVIGLLCEGSSNKAIARKLDVAEITVRHHLSAIFAKVGVASRVALVVFAYQQGLVPPPH